MKTFYLEFTANDRLSCEVRMTDLRITGLKIIYQAFQKTGKVVTDVKGFDPFPHGEWINIIRYDNLKGDAIKDIQKPTPVSFSPFGFHMKDNWGRLETFPFLSKIEQSFKGEWLSSRNNYGANITPPPDEVVPLAEKNIVKCFEVGAYLIQNTDFLNKINDGQTFIPIPKEGEDEFLLEQNSLFANRIDKKALRGDIMIMEIGNYRVLTYVPRE